MRPFWTMLYCALYLIASAGRAAEIQPVKPFLGHSAVVRDSGSPLPLVGQGIERAWIIRGRNPDSSEEHLGKAADVLANYLEKITGRKVPIVKSAAAAKGSGTRIFIGPQGDPAQDFPELRQADDHGFVIAARTEQQGTELHLASRSAIGTLYAAWFFLMNYADVRIVLPGEIGQVYAHRDALPIPAGLYVFNPAPDFLLRYWSGTGGLDPLAWLSDSGDSQRFQYHHNMQNIYPPETFGQSHPEYYPIKEGKPFIPSPQTKDAWQPTFSHPSVAQRAIEYADKFFRSQPQKKSVSLSVNDGGVYSEADLRRGVLQPDGSLSISDIYYGYINTVATAVKQRWPDKFAAFFPYGPAKLPPSFPLEDNVILFLLNEPKTTYAAWEGKVKHIGVYQWLYGMHWVIPNHWPHAIQDYLRWVREHGGQAFKGEAYGAWSHDAPKLWVLCNLLWNVDANVDALLADYFRHAYGLEAAPAVARYFAQAEQIYERRRTPEEYRITIHRPGQKQFEHVTAEDFAAMRAALEDAQQAVRGEANRRRLEMLVVTFHWAELYWQPHNALQQLKTVRVESETDVQAVLQQAMVFDATRGPREAWRKEKIEPLAQYSVFARQAGKVDWSRVEPDFDWSDKDDATRAGLAAITQFKLRQGLARPAIDAFWAGVQKAHPPLAAYASSERLALLGPEVKLANLLSNGSFEELDAESEPVEIGGPVARDWPVFHTRMVAASVLLDHQVAHEGKRSLTAKGLTDYSGVLRSMTIKNHACYRFSFWYRTTSQTKHAFYGIFVKPQIRELIPPAEEWTRVERIFTTDAPQGDKVSIKLALCLRQGGSEQSQVWFDDVRLELLSPEQ